MSHQKLLTIVLCCVVLLLLYLLLLKLLMSVDLLLNKRNEVLRHLSKAMWHGVHWLHWWAAGPLRPLTVQGAVVKVGGQHVTLLWLL